MTDHDVLYGYGYRLALFDLAGRTSVTGACRSFGVHRSTYYRWKRQVDRHGLVMLRPRERRAPRMPNQLSAVVEQRIVAYSLGYPGHGPDRIRSELARPKWGGMMVSANGVWRVLRRHGLNTRTRRLALIAGYQAPYQPPRAPLQQPHIDTSRPGQLVGSDCFFVGRLRGTRDPVWQVTAIDRHSSYAWASLVTCPTGQPTATHTTKLARRVGQDLARAGWKLERVITDNGNEFRTSFDTTLTRLGAHHTRIRAGRPQTNGHVERLHKTILDECWRPSFALHIYNTDRAHNGRITKGRIPADIIDPAHQIRPRTLTTPVATTRGESNLVGRPRRHRRRAKRRGCVGPRPHPQSTFACRAPEITTNIAKPYTLGCVWLGLAGRRKVAALVSLAWVCSSATAFRRGCRDGVAEGWAALGRAAGWEARR